MKIEVIKEKKEFKPIELKLTIETEQELCSLWHRLNRCSKGINEGIDDSLKYKCEYEWGDEWEFVDELVEKHGLKK